MIGPGYFCGSVAGAVQLELRKGFAFMAAMSPMGTFGSCSLLVLYFCISLNEGTSSVSSWHRQDTRVSHLATASMQHIMILRAEVT